jgi:hypothetical protein
MMQHWDEIARFEREGFDIVVDVSPEFMHPKDFFDDTCWDIKELCSDIDRGKYEWFMLRVRASIRGRMMAQAHLGACLYADAREVLTDGTAGALVDEVLDDARAEATLMQGVLKSLLDKQVAEAV